MNIFRHLVCVDINRGIREFQAEKNAVLVDVRSREEYDRKHIENSRSLPLSDLDRAAEQVLPEKDVPVYVYAYGGEHSAKAASRLRKLGYTDVHDIGGIKRCCGAQGYQGQMVQCELM